MKRTEIKIRKMYDTLTIPSKSKIQIGFIKDFINHPPAIQSPPIIHPIMLNRKMYRLRITNNDRRTEYIPTKTNHKRPAI